MKILLYDPLEPRESLLGPMNLQLFAESDNFDDADDIDDGGFDGEDEDDETDDAAIDEPDDDDADDADDDDSADDEGDEGDEDVDDDDKDDEPAKEDPLKKAQNAAIKHKKEAKDLKRKLEAAEEKLRESDQHTEIEARKKELVDKGFSEEDAQDKASSEIKIKALERRLSLQSVKELEGEYPGISKHASELQALKENPSYKDLTIGELYMAKFYKESDYEKKTQMELEIAAKRRKAKSKNTDRGTDKGGSKKTKMTAQQMSSYKNLKSKPGFADLTQKDFLEIHDSNEFDTDGLD